MFTRPRYHSPDRWERQRRDDIRGAAMTLARILGAETRHYGWRDGRGQRGRQRRWMPRSGPRWSDSPPGRFQCSAQRRHWRPYFYNNWRWGGISRHTPRARPPRLENPGAAQKRPSCGSDHSPPFAERRRNVREEASWGKTTRHSAGRPERSAKDPQLPHKKQSQVQARGRGMENGDAKRPAIITVEKSGVERNWGPLSKANVWRAGSYLEDIDGESLVFIEKYQKRKAVQVEKRSMGRMSGSG